MTLSIFLWTEIPCSDLLLSSFTSTTLSCVVLPFSIDLPPQAEISVCGWMRACTWRMPCQSWERALRSSQTEGFFSLCGCECLSENRPGAEWAWPAGCGSDFLLASVPVSMPTYAALGVVHVSASTRLCVSMFCTCRFLLLHTCSSEPMCLHLLAFSSCLL